MELTDSGIYRKMDDAEFKETESESKEQFPYILLKGVSK